MSDVVRSMLIGTSALSVIAVVSLVVTFSRRLTDDRRVRIGIARAGMVAIAAQTMHFIEELATGFHVRFPELLGLVQWPEPFFVVLNAAWIVIWLASLPGIVAGVRAATFPLWFLAIAGLVNLVAHPMISLVVGGYFPGLFTSPFAGWAGIALIARLRRGTIGMIHP